MRIVVAPDSFKGSLDSPRAADAIGRGILAASPGAIVATVPMADGGDGTAEVLRRALGGAWERAEVSGPRAGSRVQAGFVRLAGPGARMVVEMARASGLALMGAGPLDPLGTTTLGTGQLLSAAASHGPDSILLAAGGSATVDGGTGAARALGWRFVDVSGADLPHGGGALVRLHRIEPPAGAPGLPAVELLADVDNPLLGESGAARVFGPQKGADTRSVERLEQGLARLASRIREDLGLDLADLPGGGAAGGLGAGAVAFLGARIARGIDVVAEATRLGESLEGADWVVTGEGRFDAQSIDGKVVSGVARMARARGVRVAVLAGRADLDPALAARAGIDVVLEVAPPGMEASEVLTRAEALLEVAAAKLTREALRPRP